MPESRQVARDLALTLADRHLRDGRDVVLPQLVLRREVIGVLEQLGHSAGTFVEVILVASPDQLLQRLRDADRADPHPRDAFTLEQLGGQIEDCLATLRDHATMQPAAHLADVTGLEPEEALALVGELVGWR